MNYSAQQTSKLSQAIQGGNASISKSPMSEALERLSFAYDKMERQIERAYSKFEPVLLSAEPSTIKEPSVGTTVGTTGFGIVVDAITRAELQISRQADILERFNDRCAV